MTFNVSVHDSYPPQETALVDRGLGEANDAAAPLHEVRPLSCFAHTEAGRVVGGAVGRWWGQCCELQQLWVEASYRRRGIGKQLIQAFEARAREHGCSTFYLETFSFQTPQLYESLGYTAAYEHKVYPHGIVKYVMVKYARSNQNARLTVRPLASEDLDGYIAYFTRPSKADAERMGLAIDRVPSATRLRSDLEAMIAAPLDRLRSFVLAWCVDGKAIGHSSLKDIVPGDFGSIHLHMWRADLRGKGYGARLFCLSALDFYERFNLRRIICEPKADNPMANRMLKKIGFPLVLTHVAASSELSVVCELNRYEIRRDVAQRYAIAHAE
jgi:GNAT superfamily N-acetyltransferase